MGELAARLGRRKLAAAAAALASVLLLGGAVAVLATSGGAPSPKADAAEESPTASPTSTATPLPTATPEVSPTPILHAGILDGMPMSDAEWRARKDLLPLAVMIDNTNGAYPHAGLDGADLVYEAFVEGGITRLMAVYWRQDAEKILPVRSARTPFVLWASELGAMYGHAGGASTTNDANAIGQIFEWRIRDLNAFSDISNLYYFRDAERQGPYDLATSTAYLREAASRLGHTGPPAVESWKFREPGVALPPGAPALGLEIDFQGGRLYSWQHVQWRWDEAKKRYMRYQFGGPHTDAVSGDQLAFATVIVMAIDASVIDDVGHVVLDQEGEGAVTVFTGGQAYTGTWKKASRVARTRFYNAAGEEIVFERGPIFIEALARQSRFNFVAEASALPPMPEYTPPPPGSFTPLDPEASPTSTPSPTSEATDTQTPTPRPSATPTSTPTPGTPTRTPTPTETATPTKDPTF